MTDFPQSVPLSRILFRVLALALALPLFVLTVTATPKADETEKEKVEASRDWLGGIPAAPTEDWKIAFGGRIYDSWFHALDKPAPKNTHASYPKDSHKKGATTWRCKECHAWDYKGNGGAYSKGSHFTGVKGLTQLVGADPNGIMAAVRDKTHNYTVEMIPDAALESLALFVTRGQHETDRYVDFATKRAKGSAPGGERIYQNVCAPCHGFDGKAINFKTDDNPEFIGTVASANPWEALHKIRNGHPGVPMPALRFLPIQNLVDILAYVQTLPPK